MSDGFISGNDQQNSIIQRAIRYGQEQAELIHKKTGIPAKYVLIALGICIASVVIGYLDQYITCLVGIIFPTICSIRALESKESDDDKQWLTYWVVYGIFSFIDLFSGFILKYIPFYFIFKILFLIWLFLPSFKGASLVYEKVIYRLFNKYRPQIDELEHSLENKANQYLGKAQEHIPGGSINFNQKVQNSDNSSVNINPRV